jgi:hypothetical protein
LAIRAQQRLELTVSEVSLNQPRLPSVTVRGVLEWFGVSDLFVGVGATRASAILASVGSEGDNRAVHERRRLRPLSTSRTNSATSTRPGRKGRGVGAWLYGIVGKRDDADYHLVDVAEFDLPLLDEAEPASMGHERARAHEALGGDDPRP